MDEYVKREKVHEVVSRLQKYVWKNPVEHGPMGQIKYRITVGADDVDFEVDKIPAEDVVPVVRCKDCKNWIPGGYKSIDDPQNPQCGGRCWYSVIPRFENDFCSYGKRKEKET